MDDQIAWHPNARYGCLTSLFFRGLGRRVDCRRAEVNGQCIAHTNQVRPQTVGIRCRVGASAEGRPTAQRQADVRGRHDVVLRAGSAEEIQCHSSIVVVGDAQDDVCRAVSDRICDYLIDGARALIKIIVAKIGRCDGIRAYRERADAGTATAVDKSIGGEGSRGCKEDDFAGRKVGCWRISVYRGSQRYIASESRWIF